MSFLCYEFGVGYLILLTILSIVRNKTAQKATLVAFCVFYFITWDIRTLPIILGTSILIYISSYVLQKVEHRGIRRLILFGTILILLVELGYCKYYNFFMDSAYSVMHKKWNPVEIIVPVGISFFTFQAISYVVDVYKKQIEFRKNILDVFAYILYFPKLISGPIIRPNMFFSQLDNWRFTVDFDRFAKGFQIFLFGAIKKVVIADRLSEVVDAVYQAPGAYNTVSLIFAVLSYTIQIYCDFSGYSDMAIGISNILGIKLPANFNLPYISKNPSEFWRRWHITLSTWFRDYVYIPLGGSRVSNVRIYCNLLIVMLVSGLWHGAGWNFILWGAVHGVAQCIYRFGKQKNCIKIPTAISIVLNFIYINLSWVLFRATSLNHALSILGGIFNISDGINYISIYSVIFIILVVIIQVKGYLRGGSGYYPYLDLRKFRNKILIVAIILLTMLFAYQGETAFIYQQF